MATKRVYVVEAAIGVRARRTALRAKQVAA